MSMFRSITHELRTARDVIHGARSIATEIATLVEPKISVVLEEAKSLPAQWLALFQLALAALISRDREAALQAEQALRKERRQESKDRKAREQGKSNLYNLLIKARSFLEVAFERGASQERVGLDAGLGKLEALVLVRYGVEAYQELSQPDFSPEALIIDGVLRSPQEYAEEIRLATEQLQDAEDRLADQTRRTEQKLKVKTAALDDLHRGTLSCARILEELYSLAGQKFYAERLRRGSRSRPSIPDDPDLIAGHVDATPVDDLDPDQLGEGSLVNPPAVEDGAEGEGTEPTEEG